MMAYIKRILGWPKTRPVTMQSVETPPEPNPSMVRQNAKATAQLTQELLAVERKSWEVREELAHSTLRLFVSQDGGKR